VVTSATEDGFVSNEEGVEGYILCNVALGWERGAKRARGGDRRRRAFVETADGRVVLFGVFLDHEERMGRDR